MIADLIPYAICAGAVLVLVSILGSAIYHRWRTPNEPPWRQ